MAQSGDLVRCTNCWEGFDWPSKPDEQKTVCPRCGGKGEIIQGGFLVFAPPQKGNSEDFKGA